MIRYFVRAGDVRVDKVFDPYKLAFSKILARKLIGKVYGNSLVMLLIEYYLEGEHLRLPVKQFRVLPYSKKEHAITVVVGVSTTFEHMSDYDKKKFLVDTTRTAVNLAKAKLLRLDLQDTDFPQLLTDIESCVQEYLETPISPHGSSE
jgi:hypothetical protein